MMRDATTPVLDRQHALQRREREIRRVEGTLQIQSLPRVRRDALHAELRSLYEQVEILTRPAPRTDPRGLRFRMTYSEEPQVSAWLARTWERCGPLGEGN